LKDGIIDDIAETDPLRIVIEIDQKIRPKIDTVDSSDDVAKVWKYFAGIKHACELFEVDFKVVGSKSEGLSDARNLYYATTSFVDQLRITALREKTLSRNAVALDEDWRTKIHSYIATIRQIVQKADLEPPIKEGILKKLQALDAEVDRERSRIQIFSEALVGVCEGISSGANALTPAARLLERVIGSLARLKSNKPDVLALPKPDDLGLDAPSEDAEISN
jgi:hypothetical protein